MKGAEGKWEKSFYWISIIRQGRDNLYQYDIYMAIKLPTYSCGHYLQ